MTLADFSGIFALLAVQLRQTDADETTIRAYYAALKDLEPEFLMMSAQRMAAKADWFPKTSEWRIAAQTIEKERREQLDAVLRKLKEPLCTACDDTGWDRSQEDRVSRCACREMRRLEVLGRRPMPLLPESTEGQPVIDVQAVAQSWAATKGMR